jgi:hypothetical protein
MQTPYEMLRIKISSMVRRNRNQETFLSKKPTLTRIVADDRPLSFNERAQHIFGEIRKG